MEVPVEERQVMGGGGGPTPLEAAPSSPQGWGDWEVLQLLETYLGIYGANSPHQ